MSDKQQIQEYQGAASLLSQKESINVSALPPMTMAEAKTSLAFSPDALVLINAQGIIVLVNEQAITLFGYEAGELDDQPLEILLPERFRNVHCVYRRSYINNAPCSRAMGRGLHLRGLRKDGREFPVDINLRPVLMEQELHILGAIRDVTFQWNQERALAQQAERLDFQRTLINLSPDAILTRDPINRVLSWNRGAEELYGWTEQEVLGRIIHTLLQTRFPGSQASIDVYLEREGRWEGELVHTCRNGQLVTVESRQVLMRDARGTPTAILEINRDITRRRQLEQAQTARYIETSAQRAFLQELVNALPGGVTVVSGHDARLVLANRAAANIWGVPWPAGQPMQEFLVEHDIRIVDAQGHIFPLDASATMRALRHGETVLQYQETICQPSGAHLPILVNAVPLNSSHWHSIPSLYPGDRDGTPDREPLALVIHQDVRVLKEAEYLKDEFIGIASHELRQPLAVLKGIVGTLVLQTAHGHGTPLATWQQELLADLDQATMRLVTLTEDLLQVSRLQAGQLLVQQVSTNLVALVECVVMRLQKTTQRHQISFHSSELTLVGNIDPQRIEQVLINLLANAIKYSPQGGPITVTLEAHVVRREVEIQVRDQGIGIPYHQQTRIFGRFMRADNAQTAGISGTGLGLYLCRALVEQHYGRLWFESVENMGTTFFLTLPLETL